MQSIYFNDYLKPKVGNVQYASTVISLSLKQVSRGRFEISGDELETKILLDGEIVNVILANDIRVSDFCNLLCAAENQEPSLKFMYNEIYMQNKKFTQMAAEYKDKYYRAGSEMQDKIWFKLYSKTRLESEIRKNYQAEWIDYEKQLEKGNIIYDERKLCGVWAMPLSTLLDCFNEVCKERYGGGLFVLRPVSDCFYLDDGLEIIGDRYEVVNQLDFNNIEDIGVLCKKIISRKDNESEQRCKELREEIRSLENDKYCLIDEFNKMLNRLKIMKSQRWMFLLLGLCGVIIGIF